MGFLFSPHLPWSVFCPQKFILFEQQTPTRGVERQLWLLQASRAHIARWVFSSAAAARYVALRRWGFCRGGDGRVMDSLGARLGCRARTECSNWCVCGACIKYLDYVFRPFTAFRLTHAPLITWGKGQEA